MLSFFKKQNTAFMTLEVLISAFIISLAVLATMDITQRSIYLSRLTFHGSQAVFLNQEGAEALRIMRDNNWTNWVDSGNPGDGVPDASPSVGTIYYFKFQNGTWMLTTNSAYETVNDVKRKVIFFGAKRNASTKDVASCSSGCDSNIRGVTINTNWIEGTTYHDKLLQFYIFQI